MVKGWRKLNKTSARKGLFKELAAKYPGAEDPEKVHAPLEASFDHPEGEAGVAAEHAQASVTKKAKKMQARLEHERSNKGVAMLAQQAHYGAGVEAACAASMLTPAEVKIPWALRDPLRPGDYVLVSPDTSPNMNALGGRGVVKSVSTDGRLKATIKFSECDGGGTEKNVPLVRIQSFGAVGYSGTITGKRGRGGEPTAMGASVAAAPPKKPKLFDVMAELRSGKQGHKTKGCG